MYDNITNPYCFIKNMSDSEGRWEDDIKLRLLKAFFLEEITATTLLLSKRPSSARGQTRSFGGRSHWRGCGEERCVQALAEISMSGRLLDCFETPPLVRPAILVFLLHTPPFLSSGSRLRWQHHSSVLSIKITFSRTTKKVRKLELKTRGSVGYYKWQRESQVSGY